MPFDNYGFPSGNVGSGSQYWGSGFTNFDKYLQDENIAWGAGQKGYIVPENDWDTSNAFSNWLIGLGGNPYRTETTPKPKPPEPPAYEQPTYPEEEPSYPERGDVPNWTNPETGETIVDDPWYWADNQRPRENGTNSGPVYTRPPGWQQQGTGYSPPGTSTPSNSNWPGVDSITNPRNREDEEDDTGDNRYGNNWETP